VVCCGCLCWLAQAQQERDEVLDRLNLLDMQLTAMRSNTVDLTAALEAQRQRCAELENVLAARDRVGTEGMYCLHLSRSAAVVGLNVADVTSNGCLLLHLIFNPFLHCDQHKRNIKADGGSISVWSWSWNACASL